MKQTSDEQFLSLIDKLSPDAKFKEAHSDEFGKRRIVAVLDEELANKIILGRENKESFKNLDELKQNYNGIYYHCPTCGYVKGKLKGRYLNNLRRGIKYSCRICNSYMGTEFSHQ